MVKLVRNGHREEDVLWNYSIEKAQRYHDSILEMELEDTLKDAWMVYNACAAAFPMDTEKAAKARMEHWKKYVQSLDIDRMRKKAKRKMDPITQLQGIVPINF